jgi:hypothetical protein
MLDQRPTSHKQRIYSYPGSFHHLPLESGRPKGFHGGNCSGFFSFRSFFYAPATPAEEKPVQQYGEDQPRRVTRSSAMDIQGCRNKNRPNGTCSIADHGLSIGGAVLVAQDKQTLPGKPWMTPAMVWPLQPDGAFAQIRRFNQPFFSVPRNGSKNNYAH